MMPTMEGVMELAAAYHHGSFAHSWRWPLGGMDATRGG